LLKGKNSEASKGFVVANDADHKRAYLLTHQINRMNTCNIMVTNHNAQDYPDLFFQPAQNPSGLDHRMMFDRVICDVPCSSDAAIRKIPQKWSSWSPRESQTLHPLQIRILQKGLEMLKVGGKLSYSTCSLNPIENEAVVAAALKIYGDKI
jgi:multisite-specific tRNA:(cytosine-C5)-methyltransferase